MRKRFFSLFALLLAAAILLTFQAVPAFAADVVNVDVDAKYLYEEARSMLSMINTFRTGEDAWYLGTDNRSRIPVRNLRQLSYDYNLEKTAMQRALELAVYFSHTRPDGSPWKTAYPFPTGRYYMGENVAYGFGSASAVFKAFREDDEDYNGQGHRRNMLRKEFTRVGFGAVQVGYKIYWVQEFASGSAGGTPVEMTNRSVMADWNTLRQGGLNIQPVDQEVTIRKGTSVEMPKAYLVSNSGARNTLGGLKWKPAKTKYVKVKGSQLYGKKVGKTGLTVNIAGITLKMTASVVKANASVPDSTVDIDDYNTPLGTVTYLDPDDECFVTDQEEEEEYQPAEENWEFLPEEAEDPDFEEEDEDFDFEEEDDDSDLEEEDEDSDFEEEDEDSDFEEGDEDFDFEEDAEEDAEPEEEDPASNL